MRIQRSHFSNIQTSFPHGTLNDLCARNGFKLSLEYVATMQVFNKTLSKRGGPRWPCAWQVWHLITGCHICVGLTPKSGNAEDLSQYDPDCWIG